MLNISVHSNLKQSNKMSIVKILVIHSLDTDGFLCVGRGRHTFVSHWYKPQEVVVEGVVIAVTEQYFVIAGN